MVGLYIYNMINDVYIVVLLVTLDEVHDWEIKYKRFPQARYNEEFVAQLVPSDGSCFFSALAHQLHLPLDENVHIRHTLVDFIRSNHHLLVSLNSLLIISIQFTSYIYTVLRLLVGLLSTWLIVTEPSFSFDCSDQKKMQEVVRNLIVKLVLRISLVLRHFKHCNYPTKLIAY